jgi:hypothetical protein
MAPTAENLALVTKDLNEALYTPAYVNFLSSVPRHLLESWGAELATMPEAAGNLAQIYDQYELPENHVQQPLTRAKISELCYIGT